MPFEAEPIDINTKLILNIDKIGSSIVLKPNESIPTSLPKKSFLQSFELKSINDVSSKLNDLANGDFRKLLQNAFPKCVSDKQDYSKKIKQGIAKVALEYVITELSKELIRGYKELYRGFTIKPTVFVY